MILRNLRSSRLILQPTTLYKRNIIRLTSSNSNVPPPGNEKDTENPLPKLQHASSPEISSHHAIDHAQETPVHKTLKATKAYLSKIQGDMKPHLEPYIDKLNNASQQLKRLTSDVSDTKEALQRASRALNELTGYDQIDAVKRKVTNQGNYPFSQCYIHTHSIFEMTKSTNLFLFQSYPLRNDKGSSTISKKSL